LASATTLIHGTRDNSSVSSISQPALMLPANPELRQKLVIVGDGACGKTALLLYVPN
jgi:GTPase SAR1 family protein